MFGYGFFRSGEDCVVCQVRIRMLLQTRTLVFDCAATLAADPVAPIQCSALPDHAPQLAQHTRSNPGMRNADEIKDVRVVVSQKLQQKFRFAASSPEMYVGDPDRAITPLSHAGDAIHPFPDPKGQARMSQSPQLLPARLMVLFSSTASCADPQRDLLRWKLTRPGN